MTAPRLALALFGALLATGPAFAQAQTDDERPLSAIDWLSESVEQPATIAAPPIGLGTQPTRTPPSDESPVTDDATTPAVSVRPLAGASPRPVGLLDAALTGLPVDLWTGSSGDTVTALMQAQPTDTLPPIRDLLVMVILAQAPPPGDEETQGQFLRARVDKLLDLGALEPAQALLEAAQPDTPALFRRWFDVSLLTGTEAQACRSLQRKPDVAPTPAVRVFCLARSGDWSAAVLTLNTNRVLGDLDAATADLLARFLDPDLFEGDAPLDPPDRVSPLTFRMFEAIGAPVNTSSLPLAFAHADLRDNVGWKAQLDAAERLAERGVVAESVLIDLYTARRPAASGGVWERARAVQILDAALSAGDGDAAAQALNALWAELHPRGILTPIANAYAEPLLAFPSTPSARALHFQTLLLTRRYEAAALIDVLAETDPFLASVARGMPDGNLARSPKDQMIVAAFLAPPDPDLRAMATRAQTGEAILRSLAALNQGIEGDAMALQDGIATLRALGLEDMARRTALHFLLSEG